jgi:hypothetical protein
MEYNTVTLIPGFDVAAGGKPDVWMPSPLALVVFDGAGAISVYRRNTQNGDFICMATIDVSARDDTVAP